MKHTENELKLALYIIRNITESHILSDDFNGVSEFFLREFVSKKLDKILSESLESSIRSLRLSITVDNLLRGTKNPSGNDFMKTLNKIIKDNL
jgi:hypothetical protein